MEPDTLMQNILRYDMPILYNASVVVRASAGVSAAMLVAWLIGAPLPFVACLVPLGMAILGGAATACVLAYRGLKRDGITMPQSPPRP